MCALEKLTISLSVENRSRFIDVIDLHEIEKKIVYLSTFVFNIFTYFVSFSDGSYRPSSDDIKRTFISGTFVDCYVDYGRCHVYSLPLQVTHLQGITNNFPGGQFLYVRTLYVMDAIFPFEHEFFRRISCSFPLLRSMGVVNLTEQKRSKQCLDNEQLLSIVEYSHLTELDVGYVH